MSSIRGNAERLHSSRFRSGNPDGRTWPLCVGNSIGVRSPARDAWAAFQCDLTGGPISLPESRPPPRRLWAKPWHDKSRASRAAAALWGEMPQRFYGLFSLHSLATEARQALQHPSLRGFLSREASRFTQAIPTAEGASDHSVLANPDEVTCTDILVAEPGMPD